MDWWKNSTGLSLNWDATTNSPSYYGYCFATGVSCGGTVISTKTIAKPASPMVWSVSVSPVNGTLYYSCAWAADSSGNDTSYTGCSDGFTMDFTPPTNPTSANIFDQSTSFSGDSDWVGATAMSASWNPGTDTGSQISAYSACFSTSNTNCTPIAGTSQQDNNTSRTTTATASPDLVYGTTYYTCVASVDTALNPSTSWSCSDGFQRDNTAPPALTAANIYDHSSTFSGDRDFASSTSNISVSWDAASDPHTSILSYDVCFSTSGSSCANISGTSTINGNTSRLASTSSASMSVGSTYYVCVRSTNSSQLLSTWGCSDGFQIEQTLPTNPASNTIYDLSSTFADDLDWSGSGTAVSASWDIGNDVGSGVDTYQVCFSSSSSTCTNLAGTTTLTGNTTRTASDTATAMASGTTFYTCIKTVDIAGNVAASWSCSDGAKVDTVVPTVAFVSPLDGASVAGRPTLTATYTDPAPGSPGSIEFRVRAATTGNCTQTAVQTGSSATGLATLSNGSWTPATLATGTYGWCARSVDAAGNASAWAGLRTLTIGAVTSSLAVSSPTASLGNISEGANYFASTTVTAQTNNELGYSVLATDGSDTDGMTCSCGQTIADWTGVGALPTAWSAGSAGYFGITVRNGSVTRLLRWGLAGLTTESDVVNNSYVGLDSSTSTLLHDRVTPTGGSDTFVTTYRVNPGSKPAGTYQSTITYTLVANP